MASVNSEPLRLLIIADLRSEIARGWTNDLVERGHSVSVVSTFPLKAGLPFDAPVQVVNLGFSGLVDIRSDRNAIRPSPGRRLASHIASSKTARRMWHATNASLATLEARRHRESVEQTIKAFRPQVIHAMRIPYEGVLAASLRTTVPRVVSIWGNDLTLWAAQRRSMARTTRSVLTSAAGLHCDCNRDARLAVAYGFPETRPHAVLAGGGGVDCETFFPAEADTRTLTRLGLPLGRSLVVNPRGIRPYVRNDNFLRAWPVVLRAFPEAVAVCVGMQGDSEIERLCTSLGITDSVYLLPSLSQFELAELFRASVMSVSPSTHDGTPNTLLEAMSCGCFPVAGDIDSVGETITHETNGLLFDALQPASIAGAMIHGLRNDELRVEAARYNFKVIQERFERRIVMDAAVGFYRNVIRADQG